MEQVFNPADYLGKIMLALVFVLLAIFALAWSLKRFGQFGQLSDSQLRLVGQVSIGQREKLVIVEVGQEQLLLGVTPSQITMLHQLPAPVESDSAIKKQAPPAFAARLQQAFNEIKRGKNR
ncbi:flagellar biosynthetic protein FliO [Thiomicrospira sp. ALE5]|uniref:flagellar biosynthetic protein FliO n=1 Tax=Thiomicrospira sp. ALE5 TaxID=748650 RepID=UPI0008E6EB6A|nr:flagellar biosynthetic protein FliO [Thiomicrospira sp. ALE5]SFR59186.1 flagellar protein FliO/FliZ [Thiomicrospira sp. ALE5]